MIERKVYSRLLRWKGDPRHKPLVVKGQRQVGKSTIIEEFARREYGDYILLDLNRDRGARELFSGNLDADTVVRNIELYTDRRVDGRSTLLIFDEIQMSSAARSSLKCFAQSGKYDVIASGSLLGVALRRSRDDGGALPPVGFEEHLTMYSCDFEEFLWAKGVPKDSVEAIREDIRRGRKLNGAVLERYSSLFREFMVVGGMPEAVQTYVDTGNLGEVQKVQDSILNTITDDILRYAPEGQQMRTLACYRSIPSQLAQTNGKFQFSKVADLKGKKDLPTMEENLLWISGAGYGNFAYSLTSPELPLEVHENRKSFKVYISDTGLLVRQCGTDVCRAVLKGEGQNLGYVTENAVAEGLTKAGFVPRWYRKNSGAGRMEVDFVLPLDGKVAAVEVKSGDTKTSASLGKVAETFDIGRRIMFCRENVSETDGVELYPLFASAFADALRRE